MMDQAKTLIEKESLFPVETDIRDGGKFRITFHGRDSATIHHLNITAHRGIMETWEEFYSRLYKIAACEKMYDELVRLARYGVMGAMAVDQGTHQAIELARGK